MGRLVTYTIAGVLIVAFLTWAGDALWLRYRLATRGGASVYGSVTVVPAAALKGEKYEIYADSPSVVACAYTLLPESGYPPCWWVRRHSTEFLN